MPIENIRQSFSQGGMREKPEKMPTPPSPPKPEKKPISPYETGSFGYRLKDPELYGTTSLGEGDRIKIGEKLFGPASKPFDLKDAEEVKRELDLGSQGKLRSLTEIEKQKAHQLLKGILGK